MNDLNIPAIGKEKICSNCLRKLPTKYFLIDRSRTDGLACNCNSCLFPNGSYWKAKFPECYQDVLLPTVDPATIPQLVNLSKGQKFKSHNTVAKSLTISTETEKTDLDTEQFEAKTEAHIMRNYI